MKTGPVALVTKQCVYNIPCYCDGCYISETNWPLKVCIKEHKYNLKKVCLKKSQLAQYAYKEGYKISCKELQVLQTEWNTTYRKYKKFTHKSLADYLINQANLDISIWNLITAAKARKLQLNLV
jgi:hypothetical protein